MLYAPILWFKYIFIYYNVRFNIINLQGLHEEVSSITSLA